MYTGYAYDSYTQIPHPYTFGIKYNTETSFNAKGFTSSAYQFYFESRQVETSRGKSTNP